MRARPLTPWAWGLLALVASTGAAAAQAVGAAVQDAPAPGQVAANRERLAGRVREAARAGARYVVLPELSLTGPLGKLAPAARAGLAEPIPGPTTGFFAGLAKEAGVWVAFSLPEKVGEGHAVTAVLVDPRGRVVQTHRKVIPRPDGSDGAPLQRGDPRAPLEGVEDGGLRVAVLSGDDARSGVPRLAARGASVILIPAGWRRGEAVDWEALCDSLGRDHRVRLLVAGRSGVGGSYPREPGARPRQGPRVELAPLPPPSRAELPPVPLGLPSMPVPTRHDLSFELAELGRALFFDRGLSSDGSVSCGTCHVPGKGFADGRRRGVGMEGHDTARNVPSLLNVGYRSTLFWDGASASLELMAKFPMSHVDEMNRHYLESADYVRGRPHYSAWFQSLFPGRPVRFEEVALALAAYQRTLVSGNSPFDRHRYGGEPGALSEAARRGLALFEGKAGCAHCHPVGADSALFMDHRFHNTGAGFSGGGFKDLGLGGLSDGSHSGAFFTPGLRDAALTAPYMHDGSLATLEEVVAFYDAGGKPNRWQDPLIRPLGLTAEERAELVEFLRSLTGSARYSATGVRLDDRRRAAAGWRGGVFAVVPAGPAVSTGERLAVARRVEEAALAGARVVVIAQPQRGDASAMDEPFLSGLAKNLAVWLAAPGVEVEVSSGRRYLRETVSLFDDSGRLRVRLLGGFLGQGGAVAPSRDAQWARQLRAVETPYGPVGVVPGAELARGLPRLAELGVRTALIAGSPDSPQAPALAARLGMRAVVGDPARPAVLDATGAAQGGAPGAGAPLLAFLPAPAGSGAGAAPLGLPPPRSPADRAATAASLALGQALFFDPALSGDGKVSCASCHEPGTAFTDGRPVSMGVAGRAGHHNVPSVLNTAYRSFFTWTGRVDSLEAQVQHALRSWPEMDSSQEAVMRYLRAAPRYQPLLRAVGGEASFDTVARALADFQRTLVAGDSPFDRYWFGGQAGALDAAALRGLGLFTGKGRCATCHPIAEDHALFADDGFHNTGIGWHERFKYLGYLGDGVEGNPATENRFRGEYHTPSLRNVALTAPYMHDGSLPTLEAVVEFYDRGGNPNPNLDREMRPLGLTPAERAELAAFLRSLTSKESR